MASRYRPVAGGLKTLLPGWSPPRPGGTVSSRYCYSVWLRHLACLRRAGLSGYPDMIAELGPGESLGIGLAGLLGGATRYIGLDVVRYADDASNLRVFDELVELYERRTDAPGDGEFPGVRPRLPSYRFSDVYSNPDGLRENLAPERIQGLRRELSHVETGAGTGSIRYVCPWFRSDLVEENVVDVAYSQAVLEHVDDLEGTYAALFRWLKPGGMMSHEIDFKCHGMTPEWNGHWSYSDPVWKVIRGRRPYLLNRQVLSTHLSFQERMGFRIVTVTRVEGENGLPRRRLQPRYRNLSDEDLTTSSAHVVAVKPSH